jgi:hypothetical protein
MSGFQILRYCVDRRPCESHTVTRPFKMLGNPLAAYTYILGFIRSEPQYTFHLSNLKGSYKDLWISIGSSWAEMMGNQAESPVLQRGDESDDKDANHGFLHV